MGVRSFLWRKWKRSSFDCVAGNMRTPTLTSPNEIVPLQIGRMPPRYPNRPVFQPATAGQTYYFKRGRLSLERLLHPAGGSTLRAGFPARSRSGVGDKAVDVVERRHSSHAANLSKVAGSSLLSTGSAVDSGVNAQRAELGSAPALQVVRGDRFELFQRLAEALAQQARRLVRVCVSAALRLRDDPVDHAQFEAMNGVRLEGGRGLLGLACVSPEDGCTPLRRDDGVDRVLLHQHPVGHGRRDRAARSALADHAADDRNLEAGHQRLRAGDRAALAVLFGGDARVRARDVDQADERELVQVGKLHQPHRLAIPLGIGHAEVAVRPFLDVSSLLIADERDRATVETSKADDERVIVGPAAVPVQLDPIVEEPLDVVQRVRAVLMARELDRTPDLLVGRCGLDSLELALQLLQLPGNARASEQVEIAQARQTLA